ncbi:TlpA family protein disulfide reductase [Mesonia ostreae]|uniref:TlpA disulfide reductase family protein n=1 Tax=Mesonia ostreae TaxID=861110 RepID=A0ABU2KEV1_9FLAO|nr:TlpA disulfide reductase family protein [Mesonia ostreae]MDT0293232.1 TlpA disulfide reductase family protein [Mesonia ostreae]
MKLFLQILCIGLFSVSVAAQTQERKVFFSEAVGIHVPKYKKKAQKAYRERNTEYAEFLFDSIVKNHLAGTYIDNFNINCIKKSRKCFNDFKKPIYLTTYASWCVPGKGEIPALNELAKKYKDKIDFIVLFWDQKKKVKEVISDYKRFIDIVYVDELENKDAYIVKTMKHSLGFPTTFFIGSDKKIIHIDRTAKLPYTDPFENSYNLNFNSLSSGVSEILAHEEELLANTPFTLD